MKKAVSLLLAFTIIFAVTPVAVAAEHNGFEYTANSAGTYVITGYNNYSNDYVVIPETINGIKVTAVGRNAFQQKPNIKTVVFPETVTAIASMAFYGCKNLSSVVLSNSVTSIGSKAFNGCTGLTGINFKNVQSIGEHAFFGCKNITNITLGSKLKVIGAYAFQQCANLSFIGFNSVLSYIGKYAFANCTALTTLNLPNSLAYIGNSAFKGCTSLEKLIFGTGGVDVGAYAFESCSLLTNVTIPNTVKSIGRYAFAIRPADSTQFTHSITLTCSRYSAGTKYAKLYNAPAYITEFNKTFKAFGDIDADGVLEKSDAKKLLRIASSMDKGISGEKLFICDINCNNKIDTGDISAILRNAAGK